MASDVRIGILGPLEVKVAAGDPVEVVGPRLRALLLRLALDPDRVVSTGQLVDAVWDADPPAGAANALQSLVSRLRRLLPDVVESHPSGYRLALAPEAVDAARFEVLARTGREELTRGHAPAQAAATLREALALWRGPALADGSGASFTHAAAARLDELRLGAIEDRVEADLATGQAAWAGSLTELIAELDELVTAHPRRERLCGQLMLALAAAGRPADALAAYERLRAWLADELGIDPTPALQAIHVQVLRNATPEAAPAPEPRPHPPAPARTNLRAQITSFVGRDDDLARIAGLLGRARLVTLIGPGGAGKTRLAGEAAGRMVGAMPDGVWLAELASVVDPVDLPQAVLSLFGARELALLAPRGAGAVAPLDRLVEAVGDKRLLLVLDNCEHLVADVAALVDRLLASCPELRVLATSRELLGITGEVLHPVGPLGLPPELPAAVPGDGVTPTQALAYPAVRLLADRGAAVRPGFAVDQATVGPVLRICRALDGMPLAIELAAARLRALDPGQIAARLDDRFRLLAGGTRPALPRHQTLRAVVDWSWELLTEPERVLARRLAVFPGGATLESVEAVCARPDLGGPAQAEVLDLLIALVDKSLVVAQTGQPPGDTRFRMLETMRAYGLERRQEAGEDAELRRAHATHFLELAEQADPHLRQADQLDWLARLNAERDNLHAALRWAVDAGQAEPALRLVGALGWWWFLRSARAEGGEWATQALALPGKDFPGPLAHALLIRAMLSLAGSGDVVGALELTRQARAITTELPEGDPALAHPTVALMPAILAILAGEDDEAKFELSGTLRDNPDPWAHAVLDLMHGLYLANLGEAERAEAMMEGALTRFRSLQERWGLGQALLALAELHGYRARHDVAIDLLEEAREVFVGLGDVEDIAFLLLRLSQQRALVGQDEQALADLAEAEAIVEQVGAEQQKLAIRFGLGELARRRGDLDQARELLDEAVAGFERGGRRPEVADQLHAIVLAGRGQLHLTVGELAEAGACQRWALQIALATRDRPVVARVVELGAAIALAEGDAGRAAELLGQAETLRGMRDESDPDALRVREAARAALGDQGLALAYGRGAGRPREELMAALAAQVTTGAGTPAAPAARTPPR